MFLLLAFLANTTGTLKYRAVMQAMAMPEASMVRILFTPSLLNKIKALIARKKPGDDSVTWIEPKVLKRMAREAAEAEAAAKAAQEGESNV